MDNVLLQALRQAQAGLEVAVAHMPQTTDFVPSHVLALGMVNKALDECLGTINEGVVVVPRKLLVQASCVIANTRPDSDTLKELRYYADNA